MTPPLVSIKIKKADCLAAAIKAAASAARLAKPDQIGKQTIHEDAEGEDQTRQNQLPDEEAPAKRYDAHESGSRFSTLQDIPIAFIAS